MRTKHQQNSDTNLRGLLFDIKRDSSEDGPGIRTTVFFKGCPMSCRWCQNPEGINQQPEIALDTTLCQPNDCNRACVRACSNHCIHYNRCISINHQCCDRCDACLPACPSHALQGIGTWFSVQQLFEKVMIDAPFFRSSGGGVTLSGGEATLQMGFNHNFLKKLKSNGIHTALETCGLFNYAKFKQQLLPFLDLIYFDLKLINDETSRRYTGVSSKPILENFSRLTKDAKIPVIPRIPLIPNITTNEENLHGLSNFLKQLKVDSCVLLPFNPLYQDKLEKLGIKAEYEFSRYMTPEEEQQCVDYFYQQESTALA